MRRKRGKNRANQRPPVVSERTLKLNPRHHVIAIVSLMVLLGVVYLSTLLGGVDSGDSAELLYKSSLLGICHPPGYQIEVLFGKFFSLLPIGPDIAWRINFMMAVGGVVGVLSLYGAVRRISGQILPGLIAGLTLAFSSIYWSHCLMAEAYVFYSTFLLLGIYCVVRFVQGNRAKWLYLAAVFCGVCVADRSSELFVIPAFVVLLWSVRKKVRLNWVRLLLMLLFFVLPFFSTVSFKILWSNHTSLHGRDNWLRDAILAGRVKPPPQQRDIPLAEKLTYGNIKHAIRYCLGFNYTRQAKFDASRIGPDIDKYAWLLSGRGALGDRYPMEQQRANQIQGKGTSIGILGIVLVIVGIIFWRREYGWVLLGVGLFVGNFIFYLWHHRWDNLTFIIPGLIGLSILVGLGAAGPMSVGPLSRKRLVYSMICFVVPLFLLVSNYRLLDRSTQKEQEQQEYYQRIAGAPFPPGSVIITHCWPAMTYRYLLYIEAERKDMYVIYEDNKKQWPKLIKYFQSHRRPTFIGNRDLKQTRNTPRALAELGFVQIPPLR